jgi:transposase
VRLAEDGRGSDERSGSSGAAQSQERLPRGQRCEVKKGAKSQVGYSGNHRICGLKRHLVGDARGNPLNFSLSKANRHDQGKGLETIDGIRIGKRRRRPKRLGLDKGYDSDPLRQALRRRRIIPLASYRRNRQRAAATAPAKERHQKRYCRQRWKVERSFAWVNRFRRLDRFLEVSQTTYRAFVRVFFLKHYLDLLF